MPGLAFGPTSAMSCAVRTRENVRNMETNGGMIKSQPKVTASREIQGLTWIRLSPDSALAPPKSRSSRFTK